MSKRALITTAADVPRNLKTWTTVGLDDRDLIIVVGDDTSPHEEIEKFLNKLSAADDVPTLYLRPEQQERWEVSKLLKDGDITQRLNIGLLEALDSGAKILTIIGADVYPLTTNFYERTEAALRGGAPHWLVSSLSGWWNAGSLLDPPVTLRGYPISQRHDNPELVQETETDSKLQPAVLVHQMLGDPDVDAVERITLHAETKRYRSDTNVLLASGTWCPFSFRGAVTFTREVAALMFTWPFVGRYGDIWGSLLAQRAMQDLGRHVLFGFPVVRRDLQGYDALSMLNDELVGMHRTEHISDTLRHAKIDQTPELTARGTLSDLYDSLSSSGMLLGRDLHEALKLWKIDIDQIAADREQYHAVL